MRELAPELLVVSKTQRWSPEDFLRTLIEAEIASREASNARARLIQAAFPVTKTLEEFNVEKSSVSRATFDYLADLEWVGAKENLCLVGPPGTGKSHLLVALGHAAVAAGKRVRYFTAADLIETLYRGLADNSVGRVIEQLLRADLILIDEIGFAPMDATGAQLFFRLIAGAYEHRALGIGSHWPFEQWGRFLTEQTTAVSLLDRLLHHSVVVVTEGESYFYWPPAGTATWPLTEVFANWRGIEKNSPRRALLPVQLRPVGAPPIEKWFEFIGLWLWNGGHNKLILERIEVCAPLLCPFNPFFCCSSGLSICSRIDGRLHRLDVLTDPPYLQPSVDLIIEHFAAVVLAKRTLRLIHGPFPFLPSQVLGFDGFEPRLFCCAGP